MAKRFPRTLKLREGLRWTGKLRVEGTFGPHYIVAFDAYSPGAKQYIYDRTVLTSEQLKDWTGWEEPPADGK